MNKLNIQNKLDYKTVHQWLSAILVAALLMSPEFLVLPTASVSAAPIHRARQVPEFQSMIDPADIINPTPDWFGETAKLWSALAWGDVDNDGDLDLAVASVHEQDVIYYNEDGRLNSTPGWMTEDRTRTEAVAWGDIDDDGDLDLFFGGYLYMNQDGVLDTQRTDILGTDDVYGLALGDLNGDGWLDLVLGHDENNIGLMVYWNQNGIFDDDHRWVTESSEFVKDVDLGDMDGDGDLDIVLTAERNENLIYWNEDGIIDPVAFRLPHSTWDELDVWSIGLGDVDMDGDLDIAVGTESYEEPIYLYTNLGNRQFERTWRAETDSSSETIVVWADVDSDGDLDLAAGGDIYFNQDGMLDKTPSSLHPLWHMAFGDVNNDGHLDLAGTSNSWSKPSIRLNQTPLFPTEPDWSSDETSRTECLALGDINGDGILDLAVGNAALDGQANVEIYMSDGAAKFQIDDWHYHDGYETSDVVWGDVDGDGDLDLVTGNVHAPNQLYENVGGILQTPPVWSSLDEDETLAIDLVDYDRDGDLDLAVGNDDVPNRVYLNQGGDLATVFAKEPVWEARKREATYDLAWGDMDGDGDADLATLAGSDYRVYLNINGKLEPNPWIPVGPEYLDIMAWGDVNGDTLPDLALNQWRGPVYVYLNQGNGVISTQAAWTSEATDRAYDIEWVDIDSDGDLDLSVGNNREPDKVYLNVNGVLQSTSSWSSSEELETIRIAWGDMDGDGDPDLATVVEDSGMPDGFGFARVYRNDNGQLTTTAVWTSPQAERGTAVAWADVDLDGDDDLVIGRSNQPDVFFLSDGIQLADTPSWTSPVNYDTNDVIWGDPNGDGYPDLTIIHSGQREDHIYLNNGDGTFPITATWRTEKQDTSMAAEWADFDQDGDEDLVVARVSNVANRVYINQNGTLTPAPWSFGSIDNSGGIEWVDVDQDDDLDIVTVNATNDGAILIYNNQLNNPGPDPFNRHDNLFDGIEWFVEAPYNVNALAWGDVDSDGDLDLAVDDGYTAALYLNDNGLLQTTKSWTSTATIDVSSLAWGDMNNDGFLDLAVGVDGSNQPDHVYLNQGGQLSSTPAWQSPPVDKTSSVAWADVNGDQWLDLAVGTADDDTPVLIYLNQEGILEAVASWRSTDAENETYAVAWGDMDGDGWPDLAVGNDSTSSRGVSESPNRVYLNRQGILQSASSWESYDPYDATCVAWGDVDSDGDLDLAVTFDGGPNKVFYNVGGTIQRENAWASNDIDESQDIAWGDMDGDGDLDLAVGNRDSPAKVYRNVNGKLQEDAFWMSLDGEDEYSVAWGDVDGDGDLDLATGMRVRGNRVYLNLGDTLETAPSWISQDRETTYSVAWGDINGDGWIDLVVGNGNSPNKVYFNQNGTLQTVAGWESQDSYSTSDIVLKDMDGDGDLDLIADGHRIYFNISGILEKTPSWVSSNDSATSVAVGDIDGDGDYDFVTGHSGQSNNIYLNPLRHKSTQANAPIYAKVTRPTITHAADYFSTPEIISSDTIPITYTLFAPSPTKARRIRAEYSLDGGGIWHMATQAEGGSSLTELAVSPTGTEHIFVWHVKADKIVKHDSVIFRIRVFGNDTHSPILWPAQDAKTLPFRVEDSWYIKVVDDNNAAVADAHVYANGEYVGQANRAGLVAVDVPIAVGTPLIAFATQYEQRTGRDNHDGWSYRIVTFNHDWAGEEFVVNEVASAEGVQKLTLRRDGPLVLFNLVVAIEWDATDVYLTEIQEAMGYGSDYLYDVSNGQMAFGEVTIYDNAKVGNGELWHSADIKISTPNIVRPYAYIGQILSDNPNTVIHLGRKWDGFSGSRGAWSAPFGYRTIVHEFMHYAVHVYDEYISLTYDGHGNITGQIKAHCIGPENENHDTDHINVSMMDRHYHSSEMSAYGVPGGWSENCEETEQYQRNGGSAWDTFYERYSDTQTPARWNIITPMALGRVIAGPNALPTGYPAWPQIKTVTNTENSPPNRKLTVIDANDAPYQGVLVTLHKTNGQVIEQGFTENDTGELMIYGAAMGDTLRMSIFKDGLEAVHLIKNDDEIVIKMAL